MKSHSKIILQLKLALIFTLIAFTFSQNTVNIYQTPWAGIYSGNIFALAYHRVYCNAGEVISSWKVERSGDYMSFRYYCLKGLSVLDEPTEFYTGWNGTSNDKNESLNFLDRHEVRCPEDSAINGFQMEQNGNYIRFRYVCNRVKYNSMSSYTTDFVRSGTGESHGLSAQEVKAPEIRYNLQALQGFKLAVRYSTRWCTFLCSDYQDIRFTINYIVLRNITPNDLDN